MKFFRVVFFLSILSCVLGYVFYTFYSQQIRINDLNAKIASCERKIQEQNLESEKLNTMIVSMTQDEYIEEIAREKLGYVMPSEIIFMDASI